MADDEIRLPVDLPGYDESLRKLTEIVKVIEKVQSEKTALVKAEKDLQAAYGRGEGSWRKRRREAGEYYKELTKINNQLDRLSKAGGAWAQYIGGWKGYKKAMRFEGEKQRMLSMSSGLEGSAGLGISFKGLKDKKRWGNIPKSEARVMRDLAGAANAGFWEKDFSRGMNKATRAQRKHGEQAKWTTRVLGIEARWFKWMLGFALMGTNAIKKLTAESKVFNTLWGVIGKAFGFILDMIILPLAPFILWIAEGMFAIGEFIMKIMDAATEAHPALAGLLGILMLIGGAAIVIGLVQVGAAFLGMESTALAAAKMVGLLGLALEGLLALGAIAIVVYIADELGVANQLAKIYWVAGNFLKGMYWDFAQWVLVTFENLFAKILEIRDSIINVAQEIHEYLFGKIPGFGGGSSGGRRGDGSTQQSYTYKYRDATNPFLADLGLSNYDPSMGDYWNLINKRWEELYPGGWKTYEDQIDSFGYTGRPQASASTVTNNLTVNEMNIGIDPTDFQSIMDEASRRAWETQNRSVIQYYR